MKLNLTQVTMAGDIDIDTTREDIIITNGKDRSPAAHKYLIIYNL